MIAAQDFVPGLHVQRSGNQIYPVGRIGYEHEVIWGGPEEFAQWLDGSPNEVMILPSKEQYRLLFQLSLPELVLLKDWFGTGTE